jgi:acetyl esterase/lipase
MKYHGILLFLALLNLAGCTQAEPEPLVSGPVTPPVLPDSGIDAPPPPEGFKDRDAAIEAVMTGEVRLITLPADIPEFVREFKDVEYGNVGGDALKLDLYLPKAADKPVPGLILLHGGGWESGRRRHCLYYCLHFAQQGYAAATITYRLSDEAKFPAPVQDAKCAVRWMRANAATYGIDPDRIGLVGGSAGGHLALTAAYTTDVPQFEGDGGHQDTSSRVQAVVNLYGPSDLTTPQARETDAVRKFLGAAYWRAPERHTEASPLAYVTPDDPPTLILHGTVDEMVPIEQSDALAARLAKHGVPVVYDRLEGWPHLMDAAQVVNERCRFFMDAFFDQYLRQAG